MSVAVLYVGDHSAAKAKFDGKFLAYDARKGAWTLDPRFPDVRAYLLGLYLDALRDWDLRVCSRGMSLAPAAGLPLRNVQLPWAIRGAVFP